MKRLAVVALVFAGAAGPAAAQRPGEVIVHVTDVVSGDPVRNAEVTVVEQGVVAATDVGGRLVVHLRRADSPLHLRVVASGFEVRDTVVVWTSDRDVHIRVVPALTRLSAITVQAARSSVDLITRNDIARHGDATAADVLRRVPGVLVNGNAAGGPSTISIRGSPPTGVLVLVDGVPLNDAVTGAADLSRLDASVIDTLYVLPGAHSARFGARAEGGVVVIRTGRSARGVGVAAGTGSLGTLSARASAATRRAGISLGHESREGAFEYVNPANGARTRRANADATRAWMSGSAATSALDVRVAMERMRRGLPGLGYAPARRARQEGVRAGVQASLSLPALRVSASLERQALRHRDPEPPAGLPYDDSTAVLTAILNVQGSAEGGGAEMTWSAAAQSIGIRATTLARAVRQSGVSAQAGLSRPLAGGIAVSLDGRVDHEVERRTTWPSFAAAARATRGRLGAQLVVRNSFTPPTPADLHFESTVGVEPNPDLRPQRVPLEAELRVTGGIGSGAASLEARGAVHAAGIRDLIIWAPDYRFVWTPQNVDARRFGSELGGVVAFGDIELGATWHYTNVTYTAMRLRGVQVPYRPRSTLQIDAAWVRDAWHADLHIDRIGTRTTGPTPLNTLPAFWSFDVALSRSLELRAGRADVRLRVDRLFNERGSLLFGVPHPGRTLRLELEWCSCRSDRI